MHSHISSLEIEKLFARSVFLIKSIKNIVWNWNDFNLISGELVGGLDILKEMNSNGELKTMLDEAKAASEPDYKALINKHPLMIFMKGNPEEPKCGFSRTLIGILNETGIPYGTFDIFSDEDVRQGLKKYSNWPTYPQVYVKGELVGGLDIIKELKESGDLDSTLKGEWIAFASPSN